MKFNKDHLIIALLVLAILSSVYLYVRAALGAVFIKIVAQFMKGLPISSR